MRIANIEKLHMKIVADPVFSLDGSSIREKSFWRSNLLSQIFVFHSVFKENHDVLERYVSSIDGMLNICIF